MLSNPEHGNQPGSKASTLPASETAIPGSSGPKSRTADGNL